MKNQSPISGTTNGNLKNEKEVIRLYNEKHSITLTPENQEYTVLKKYIIDYTEGADDSFKLLVSEEELENIRSNSTAVELIFEEELPMDIQYLKSALKLNTISVKKILIPISRQKFPESIIFVYLPDGQFYTLSNKDGEMKEKISSSAKKYMNSEAK